MRVYDLQFLHASDRSYRQRRREESLHVRRQILRSHPIPRAERQRERFGRAAFSVLRRVVHEHARPEGPLTRDLRGLQGLLEGGRARSRSRRHARERAALQHRVPRVRSSHGQGLPDPDRQGQGRESWQAHHSSDARPGVRLYASSGRAVGRARYRGGSYQFTIAPTPGLGHGLQVDRQNAPADDRRIGLAQMRRGSRNCRDSHGESSLLSAGRACGSLHRRRRPHALLGEDRVRMHPEGSSYRRVR